MSSMDMPADAPRPAAQTVRASVPAAPRLTWLTLALMTTASVASLRAAPTMAVYGLACVFLYLVPAIVFLLPTALVSAELAAAAIVAHQRGRLGAFDAYDRAMQRRFLAKDAVSWLVQAFLGRPFLFDYAARRVAARATVRATMGLVMGDLVPAGRALDPRFLAALLVP